VTNALAVLSSRERFYEESRQEFEAIIGHLDSEEAQMKSHSEIERELEKTGRELMRKLLQEHLEARGPGESTQPVRGSDGVERTRVRPQERKLETIFGPVSTERTGYGQKGSPSLHPLDAELNLPPHKYSLELSRRVAEEAAKNSFDESLDSIHKITGAHVPKRQLKRQAGGSEDKDSGSIMVLSADGKGVVMRIQDLREQTRKAALKRRRKMGARLSKGEKKNAKRTATVATVYTIDPFVRRPEDLVSGEDSTREQVPRPRPENKRVWASLEKTPEEVIEKAFEEAASRDPTHRKKWVALVDGNKPQIRILRRISKEKGIDLTIIVDIIHVIEYLWDAGRVFYPESGPELESWVRVRILEILRGKAGYVAGGMRRSATLRDLVSAERKPVDVCANYLLTYAPYLKYDRYLARGFPIATGVIEGACRHLVKDRMELTGARWSLAGAEAVLRLRALRSSHDFDEYWTFHEAQEYERNHRSLYAGGDVPSTLNKRSNRKRLKSHLEVIK